MASGSKRKWAAPNVKRSRSWRPFSGSCGSELPLGVGDWNAINRRLRNCAHAGVFELMFNDLSDPGHRDTDGHDPLSRFALKRRKGSARHHIQASLQRTGRKRRLDRSLAGHGNAMFREVTQILALIDACGKFVRFVFVTGNLYVTVVAALSIQGLSFDTPLADTAFEGKWIVSEQTPRTASPPKDACCSLHMRQNALPKLQRIRFGHIKRPV